MTKLIYAHSITSKNAILFDLAFRDMLMLMQLTSLLALSHTHMQTNLCFPLWDNNSFNTDHLVEDVTFVCCLRFYEKQNTHTQIMHIKTHTQSCLLHHFVYHPDIHLGFCSSRRKLRQLDTNRFKIT